MRDIKLIPAVLITAVLTACALGGTRQIAEIRQFPGKFDDRSVSIEGQVTSSWSVPFVPIKMYQVDDGTGQMTVLAEDARVPTKGARVRVRGKLSEFGTFGDRSIGLHLRQESVDLRR
jgi:hypothetical protein